MNRFKLIWLFLLQSLICIDGWIPTILRIERKELRSPDILRHVNTVKYDRSILNGRRRLNRIKDDNDDDDSDDDVDDVNNKISGTVSDATPQLPPIGATALSNDPSRKDNMINNNDKPFVANHKFQIQYTCNICETRNTNTISRLAYRQGVVIARCKGCQSQHLIADHLGWTDHEGGFQGNTTNTIEDYFANDAYNKTNVTINRVNTDVFELEKILQYNTGKSGAIVGDDGKLALE
jgi:hypothetical protein